MFSTYLTPVNMHTGSLLSSILLTSTGKPLIKHDYLKMPVPSGSVSGDATYSGLFIYVGHYLSESKEKL